jgi:hypothetical protein
MLDEREFARLMAERVNANQDAGTRRALRHSLAELMRRPLYSGPKAQPNFVNRSLFLPNVFAVTGRIIVMRKVAETPPAPTRGTAVHGRPRGRTRRPEDSSSADKRTAMESAMSRGFAV